MPGWPSDKPERRPRRAARTLQSKHFGEAGEAGVAWGISNSQGSPLSYSNEPRAQATLWHWGGGGEESSSVSNPVRQQSWGQGRHLAAAATPLPGETHQRPVGWCGKAGNTACPGHASVVAGDRATWGKGHSSSPGARPRPQLVRSPLGKTFLECNQLLCSSACVGGGGWGHRTLDVNKHTNVFRPDTCSSTHCWSVLKPLPQRVKTQQSRGADVGRPTRQPSPHQRRAPGQAQAALGPTQRRGLASASAHGGGTPPPLWFWTEPSLHAQTLPLPPGAASAQHCLPLAPHPF